MMQGKRVAVIGGGVEGQESARWLQKQHAVVTILDRQEITPQEKGILYKTGEAYLSDLSSYDLIVRSPGVKPDIPELLQAQKQGIVITTHVNLFFAHCQATMIGVTGTKGKGTTASLIYEMLKKDGKDVYLGGNIGVPPLSFVDKLKKTSWVVLELSSFQLEDIQYSPHIAVMLMIVPEHLGKDVAGTQNYHESMEVYVAAKRTMLRFQQATDYAVLNRDYVPTLESDVHTQARVFQVTTETEVEDGCFVRQGRLIIRKDGTETEIMKIADAKLLGRHNIENICAAAMAASLAGVKPGSIASVVKQFAGLPHRLQLVATKHGVLYYDDSFSTTPETAIAAIESFSNPLVLVLGGSGKNSDFTDLGEVIAQHKNIKAIIGIGSEWNRMKSQLPMHAFHFPVIENLVSMDAVVKKAAEVAAIGDVVLLSPACASFGMFKNYKERGELFADAAQNL